jgi:hypothetical protein
VTCFGNNFLLGEAQLAWTFGGRPCEFPAIVRIGIYFGGIEICFSELLDDLCLLIDDMSMTNDGIGQLLDLLGLSLDESIRFLSVVGCCNVDLLLHHEIEMLVNGQQLASLLLEATRDRVGISQQWFVAAGFVITEGLSKEACDALL